MANYSKTIGTSLLSLQSVASNTVVISSTVAVTTTLAAMVFIHFGRRTTSALTASMNFRIEGSAKSSGDGFWFPLATYSTDTAAATSHPVNGTCASGQNVIAMTSTTSFAVGDIVYIDNGTIANSEWGRTKVVTTNTSITIEDNLNNAQTSSTVYNKGEMIALPIDLSGISRIRLVVDGSNTGQACAVEAWYNTLDSFA